MFEIGHIGLNEIIEVVIFLFIFFGVLRAIDDSNEDCCVFCFEYFKYSTARKTFSFLMVFEPCFAKDYCSAF